MIKDEFFKKSEYFIKLSYIIISILSMSSLIYSKISLVYKLATLALILISIIFIYKRKYYSDEVIITIVFLIGANILTTVVNIKSNFIGNISEIVFMCSYLMIMIVGDKDIIKKLFVTVSYIIQLVSFLE